MSGLLEQAILRVKALPDQEQDAIAAQILAVLDDEESWDNFLTRNAGEIQRLADEALAEHRRGETRPLSELLGE
ncbi:MAG: hypothetical protein HY820_18435 [Acidobacteria bacterium]|nr:hypothetical protein [Acidobacteriota bacterium]